MIRPKTNDVQPVMNKPPSPVINNVVITSDIVLTPAKWSLNSVIACLILVLFSVIIKFLTLLLSGQISSKSVGTGERGDRGGVKGQKIRGNGGKRGAVAF